MQNHDHHITTPLHSTHGSAEINNIWQLLETVPDPEIPVLSVVDLGVIRNVSVEPSHEDGKTQVIIYITPTYSGCPAMDMISMQVRIALLQHGYKNVEIKQILSPAWTTDWMSEEGKRKLAAFGIAPPVGKSADTTTPDIACPHCHSFNTHLISQFGSTSCKALYQCYDCKEPFDYFKCH